MSKRIISIITLVVFAVVGITTWWFLKPGEQKDQVQRGEAVEIAWTKDQGARIGEGSVPYTLKLPDGKYRLYYCWAGGILSAISDDGLNFTEEPGIRISGDPSNPFEKLVCDPTVVRLPDGHFRMYYKGADGGQGGPGQAIHKIFSAISPDGLSFQKEGLRVDSETSGDNGWASVPEAVLLPDGRVRIYYVSGDFSRGGMITAISDDGLTFTDPQAVEGAGGLVDPAITILPDGRFLLFVASINPNLSPYLPSGIYSLISSDGVNFSSRQKVLERKGIFDPTVVQIDENILRVYFGKVNPPQTNQTESITGVLQ